MKYDITKEPTRGAKRTLDDFKNMMFMLLSEKAFEEITVGELCRRANYPRATFYNYFDDKFDLLNYCWLSLTEEIHLEDYHLLPHDETLYIFFNRIYDFSKNNESIIRSIFRTCPDAKKSIVPKEILADHYSNTLMLICQWCTLKNQEYTKKQALQYLEYLVGKL